MDLENGLIMAVSNAITSFVTALVTAKKTRAEIEEAKEAAFAKKYEVLYNELYRHQAMLKAEVDEGKQEIRLVKEDHRKCTTTNRKLLQAMLKIQERLTRLEGKDESDAFITTPDDARDVLEIIDGIDTDIGRDKG